MTYTRTWTRVDVLKVFEAFQAHLRMIVRRTGLESEQWAENGAHDVTVLAADEYLDTAHVMLFDRAGREVRAKVFRVEDESVRDDERPGGSASWPQLPDGSLCIVVKYTAAWWALTEAQRAAVRAVLKHSWGPSSLDTSHASLSAGETRFHTRNGYGLKVTDYT
ncbi:MAG: hypothetical protein ACOZNI_27160 [Myxococcota bacterium]